MTRVVRAPGKLVLVGEYAVLDGGGAIVAAVDHGVQCTVTTISDFAADTDGAADPGRRALPTIITPGDDRFVRAALEGAPPAIYTFSDWNPVDLSGAKPGFGGSAAATVAAVIAADLPPRRAYEAHAAVQGSGSGVDVFASLLGDVRSFPDGLTVECPPLLAVWSGQSAKTGPRVTRYQAWRRREQFVEWSRTIVRRFSFEPIAAFAEAYELLKIMSESAGIDYDTPAHARIAALAADHGGAAKPSGAGGGDVAVACLPDLDALDAFGAACAAEGLLPIPVQIVPGAWSGPIADARPVVTHA